jgi:hypothetical protein
MVRKLFTFFAIAACVVGAPVAAFAQSGDVVLVHTAQSDASVFTGETNTFTADFAYSGDGANVLIDLELKDSSGNKVAQQFWDNAAFPGQSTFTLTTSPDLPVGIYHLSVGIFNPGWAGLRHWYNNQEEFSVMARPSGTGEGVSVVTSWETKSSLNQGETNEFYAQFHNGSSTDQTVLGDIELFNSSGTKIHQTFADNVTLSPDQNSVGGIMSPDNLAPGTYYYSVGIFTPGWGSLIHWYHHLQEFQVN